MFGAKSRYIRQSIDEPRIRNRKKAVLLSVLSAPTISKTRCPPSEMSEPPFRPREKLVEKQKYFQSVHKPTYLKGPYDKITSVAIPIALASSALYLIGRGIYNMSYGIGKKE